MHTDPRQNITTPSPDHAGVEAVEVRQALPSDASQLHSILTGYASDGVLLPRTLDELYLLIPTFVVAASGPDVLGFGSLHIYDASLAEIRSLAVHPELRRHGIGRFVVERLVGRARQLQIPRVFALTYQGGFFERMGFTKVDKQQLPQKIWHDCVRCAHFPVCKEDAYWLDTPPQAAPHGDGGMGPDAVIG